jgi:hypothetical protein
MPRRCSRILNSPPSAITTKTSRQRLPENGMMEAASGCKKENAQLI